MIKKEWQAIRKNKFFIVIIVALATIPALYNLIFLSSMWDPYGKISDLPVAVVNEDKSATINGKTVNLGDDLVDELGKSRDLDYHFVSNRAAQKGLKDDKYYMQITIPSDFSKNAGSLVSNDPTDAVIHYQTSVGHNFIASKMSESAMEKLKEKVSENITKTYTKTIFENLTTLSDGVTKAADGSNQLVNGSGELKSGANQIATNLDKLSSSSLTFKDGAETLNVGLGQYTAGVTTLSNGANDLSQAVTKYTNGATQVAEGNSKLNAASGQLSEKLNDIDQLVKGSSDLSNGLSELSKGMTLAPDVQANIAALQEQLSPLNEGIQAYNQSVQNSAIPESLTQDLINIGATLQKMQADQADQATKLTTLKETDAYKGASEVDKQTLEGLITIDKNEFNLLSTAANDLQTQLTALKAAQDVNKATIAQLSTRLTTAKNAVDTQILPVAQQISAGTALLKNQLTAGVSQFSTATAQLNTGAQNLVSNNAQLTAGAAKLATGANQLNQNSAKLLEGSGQLATGSGQISNGSTQLATGANTLTTGIGTLQNGASTLATGLGEAKTKLATNQTKQTNAEKIAKPLKLTHTDKDNSPENGVGMAPYMMSVALFVGAVATNMIISGTLSGEKAKHRRDYLLGRLAVNGVIAVGEGILVYLAVHVLGLSANHEFAMFGFTILVAFTFMFIVTFFNTWLGKPGAFLMLILLLLQLAASAGTYPLALTSTFFQKINPWMPMTYAVTGFRQVISLTGQIGQETGILLVLSIISLVLLALVGNKKAKS